MIRLSDDVECQDDEGNVEGFQFAREVSLQEWRDRKEQEEFDRLCETLYQRKWAADNRERLREKKREAARRYRESNPERLRRNSRNSRRKKYEANPVVNQCKQCGKYWTPPYEQKVKRSSFCSKKCRNKWSGDRRVRSQGIRQMAIRPRIVAFLRRSPLSTWQEIAQGVECKPGSTRTILSVLVREGILRRSGPRLAHRYEISPEWEADRAIGRKRPVRQTEPQV